MSAWQSAEAFRILCDQVASDHLVCLTGAGISKGMKRAGSSWTLPDWKELLTELFDELRAQMDAADTESVGRLLGPHNNKITSDEFILAASLIRRADRDKFDTSFRAAITDEPGQASETHRVLLDLFPRGIMTFNYDRGHETACQEAGCSCDPLNPTDPSSETRFRRLMECRLEDFFLLKAHGSVDSTEPLVLTTEEYRNLLVKNPGYRSFVQHLFTNFSFLIVGYGLDDPDFALFTRTMADRFGGPLQKHVVLRLEEDRAPYEEVERHLYGIHTLHVDAYTDIPDVLRAAARTPGPALRKTLELCLSTRHEDRTQGHVALAALGRAGRAVAGAALLPHLQDKDSFRASEAAYSLGLLDPHTHKDALCELIDSRPEADVLGRTLTVLRSAFVAADIPRLEAWRQLYTDQLPEGERAERIPKYLDYLVLYVEHKFKSDPPAI